jgi:hypothetical protein
MISNEFPDDSSGFESRNCVDVLIIAEGDTTVRPCRPSLLKQAMAEREKIAKWQALLKQNSPPDQPKDDPNGSNQNP